MNGFVELQRPDAARLSRAAARAEVLSDRYGELEGEALLRVMLEWEYNGRIALVSSFGAEAAVADNSTVVSRVMIWDDPKLKGSPSAANSRSSALRASMGCSAAKA